MGASGNPGRETASILIVDDMPENLRLLVKILTEQKYAVHPATRPDMALVFLETQVPDLILLDIHMPGMTGFELCARLKARPETRDVPVIFLSAEHHLAEKSKAFECGAVDYITKPFQEKEVLLRIRTHVALRQLQRRLEERTQELESALARLSEANERLLSLSLHDGLTGLKNRRFFDECLAREWEHARREHTSLALLMIDIDHFKRINDSYGHPVGDECLKAVALAVRHALKRAIDEAARYGGEEIAVILPNTGTEGAACVAESIRSEIERTDITADGRIVRLTASIGVAGMAPAQHQPCGDLIGAADRALYLAKCQGRNRVVVIDGARPA